ncbi:DnaJ domain-containing protein [bacterium]|nr:DnaJ domain-containing protein [bacterium]
MEIKDYYKILGVPETASTDDIKRAFRKLAKKYHPDINKNPGAGDKFKEINEAYQILSNSEKRKKYDDYKKYGGSPFGQGGQSGGFNFQDIFGNSQSGGVDDLTDIFSSFFSTKSKKRDSYENLAIHLQINLGFEESIKGIEKRIRYKRSTTCPICGGTGASRKETCPSCRGSGHINRGSGFFAINQICPTCKGTGYIIKEKCSYCNGTGKMMKEEEKTIRIPSGAREGDKITLDNYGNSNGRVTGPLILYISVMPSTVYERDENDLIRILDINLSDALLGSEKDIDHFGKKIGVKIPVGTNNGNKLKLKGLGVKRGRYQGDLYLTINLKLPKKLNKKQKLKLKDFLETL